MMQREQITIKQEDTGIVYQDAATLIMWLPGKGGYWESDGEWATAVMIDLTPGHNYNTVSFHANDHMDLQDCIDDHFYDEADEPPNINER